ncbi:MAG: autotransporter outer membrane beta-barrel domain-containing protein [Endozoicomonas sp.]|uniref:autotransporter outer membrane beta-barrel domain-containing protein n=1 Tax=Endozoicomonas sp. TaxID=1892382 RepID=UPI003D9B5350
MDLKEVKKMFGFNKKHITFLFAFLFMLSNSNTAHACNRFMATLVVTGIGIGIPLTYEVNSLLDYLRGTSKDKDEDGFTPHDLTGQQTALSVIPEKQSGISAATSTTPDRDTAYPIAAGDHLAGVAKQERNENPDNIPIPDASARGALTAAHDISLASGMLSMDGMSSLRNLMKVYRTGRMFEYGQVSLDNLTAAEMVASTREGNFVPARDRRSGDWHSFVQGYGRQGSFEGLHQQVDSGYGGYGLDAGVFSQSNEDLVLGLMVGVQTMSLNRKDKPGSVSLESFRFGPFLSWSRNDWHLDAALLFARNQYALERRDEQGRRLKADLSGAELMGYLALGYDVHLDHWKPGLTVTPMAEIFYSHLSHGGFKEKEDGSRALKVNSQSNNQLITRLGAEVGYVLPNLEKHTEVNLRLGWQHQNLNTGSTSFQLPGQGVSGQFDGKGVSDSGLFYGASIHRRMSEISDLSLAYTATSTGKGLSHGLQFQYEWQF